MGAHGVCGPVSIALLDRFGDGRMMLQCLEAALMLERFEAVFDQGTDRFIQRLKDEMEKAISARNDHSFVKVCVQFRIVMQVSCGLHLPKHVQQG